jgi:hypothetical protein
VISTKPMEIPSLMKGGDERGEEERQNVIVDEKERKKARI